MNLTNLIVLSVTILTNATPGGDQMRRFGNHIVGIQDIVSVYQIVSLGFMDGTNPVQVVDATKLLTSKTNWIDLPMVTGVQSPSAPRPSLLSNPQTIKAVPAPPTNSVAKPAPVPTKAAEDE